MTNTSKPTNLKAYWRYNLKYLSIRELVKNDYDVMFIQ
ncbi:hypothetical protein CPM_1424 [Cuniculiplasma divulgatum]|uniref:Uncharacterized protein n=1 Tax=Cuniculiplasma divulgatum TaxID=1673428 RepID=A0A1R4A8B9_9ARCH|nr:hypothetical protein CPM_1424 [Cuniculiplasma divulgatum]